MMTRRQFEVPELLSDLGWWYSGNPDPDNVPEFKRPRVSDPIDWKRLGFVHQIRKYMSPLAAMYGITLMPIHHERWSVWVEGVNVLGLVGESGSTCQYSAIDKRVYCWGDECGVENVLHELVHLILHHPTHGPDLLEESFLLQFQWALARSSIRNRTILNEVHRQMMMIELDDGSLLGDYRSPTRKSFWRRGLALCRRLGILDDRNRPTWRYPRWSRIRVEPDGWVRA